MVSRNAKTTLSLPQSNKSAAKINSIQFIIAIIKICTIAFKRDFTLLKIHIAINTSAIPIAIVNGWAYIRPNMRATML